jgi:hypothetical protein
MDSQKVLFRIVILCLTLVTVFTNNLLLAGRVTTDSITVKKCKDFKITSDGNSEPWGKTEWINLDQQGSDSSIYKTQVKVLYSEKGIYFLFCCEDKKLNPTKKADFLNLYKEDVVEVFLWTDENFPIYFEYELSPLNYELPLIVPNFEGNYRGWLPWLYEGERKTLHQTSVIGGKKKSGNTITGWRAEFFIPYTLLFPLRNIPPVSGTRWKANMYRIDYDFGRIFFAWQKVARSFHEYDHFGTFIFE